MGPFELVFTPGIQEVSFTVKHDQRVLAPTEYINPVPGIGRNIDSFEERPARGHFRPID
jgi:hypothetical protein